MSNGAHCADLQGDRALGDFWEAQFGALALQYGRAYTRHQLRRQGAAIAASRIKSYTLPDITVWTGRGEHHEVKHKDPTRAGWFGLEAYRFEALMWLTNETKAPVFYTIHNHALAGGRDVRTNDIAHWLTVDVRTLDGADVRRLRAASYVNGQLQTVEQLFWPVSLWFPLADLWDGRVVYGVDGQRLTRADLECPGIDWECEVC